MTAAWRRQSTNEREKQRQWTGDTRALFLSCHVRDLPLLSVPIDYLHPNRFCITCLAAVTTLMFNTVVHLCGHSFCWEMVLNGRSGRAGDAHCTFGDAKGLRTATAPIHGENRRCAAQLAQVHVIRNLRWWKLRATPPSLTSITKSVVELLGSAFDFSESLQWVPTQNGGFECTFR